MDTTMAKALSALMECNTFTEAAEKTGISRRTLYNYIRNDKEFARAYRTMHEQLVIDTIEDAIKCRKAAINVLMSIVIDSDMDPMDRIRAANIVVQATTADIEKADGLSSENVSATSDPFDMYGRG